MIQPSSYQSWTNRCERNVLYFFVFRRACLLETYMHTYKVSCCIDINFILFSSNVYATFSSLQSISPLQLTPCLLFSSPMWLLSPKLWMVNLVSIISLYIQFSHLYVDHCSSVATRQLWYPLAQFGLVGRQPNKESNGPTNLSTVLFRMAT